MAGLIPINPAIGFSFQWITTMKLSEQQLAAMKAVEVWAKTHNGPQVFRLFGYAGTGKTTITRHVIENLGWNALYAAFTGKAASVMRKNGCYGATTIHSLIYKPVGSSTERSIELKRQLEEAKKTNDVPKIKVLERRLSEANREANQPNFVLRDSSPLADADILVIDEASMVDERMGKDLESFGCRILVLGDPGQLPPIKGQGYFVNDQPDIMLTEIHRQAADNPILMLATLARQGKQLPKGTWGDTKVVTKLDASDALGANQLLVGMNKTRIEINQRMRQLLGHTGVYPVAGERLISLRNNHELGLLNGSMWVCSEDALDIGDDHYSLSLASEDDPNNTLAVVSHGFPYRGIAADMPPWELNEAHEFYYGYAVTVHKSQGSQWERVLLMDEWTRTETRRKWLYTGITRAQSSLIVYASNNC